MSDSLLKKIRALLAKANDTSVTEAEAEAFNQKAHELMLKYNIDRAMIDDQTTEVVRGHMTLKVQVRPWSSYVLAGITKLYYCKYFSREEGRSHIVTIVGEEQNLAVCHAICVMVLRSIQEAARKSGGGRSFMTGAGLEVHRRCHEMYQAAHTVLPSSPNSEPLRLQSSTTLGEARALVTLDKGEAAANLDYIQKTLGIRLGVRRSTGAQINNSNAFRAGTAHGASVQLRRNLLK